jgi:hypothetical protein
MAHNGVALRGANLTLSDFDDAVNDEKKHDEYCGELFDGLPVACTRHTGHDGPHVAAITNRSIVAVWEECEGLCRTIVH